MLAALIVFVVHRHTAQVRAAGHVLHDELQRLEGEAPGLERTRTEYLARKVVLKEIDRSRPNLSALLNVLGTLPDGVRLDSVETLGAVP